MPSSFFLLVSVFLLTAAATATAAGMDKIREFRPLEAKQVMIRPGAKVGGECAERTNAKHYLRRAWADFDAKNWAGATDAFVSALEADPACREAAEGLAMSIYHTGDFTSAYRFGEELKTVMPNVRRVVAETALSDVRSLIARGEFAEARSFLTHFPATGPILAYAHELVQTADTLTASVGKSEAGGDPLARN